MASEQLSSRTYFNEIKNNNFLNSISGNLITKQEGDKPSYTYIVHLYIKDYIIVGEVKSISINPDFKLSFLYIEDKNTGTMYMLYPKSGEILYSTGNVDINIGNKSKINKKDSYIMNDEEDKKQVDITRSRYGLKNAAAVEDDTSGGKKHNKKTKKHNKKTKKNKKLRKSIKRK